MPDCVFSEQGVVGKWDLGLMGCFFWAFAFWGGVRIVGRRSVCLMKILSESPTNCFIQPDETDQTAKQIPDLNLGDQAHHCALSL